MRVAMPAGMRVAALVLPPWIATFVFWALFAACIDAPDVDSEPIARVMIVWDPLACGAPHRVAVELEDSAGYKLSSSTPCNAGGLAIDAPHLGVYYGRIYAWEAGTAIRSIMPVRLFVEDTIVRWLVATPP